jgi:hypothetical protein
VAFPRSRQRPRARSVAALDAKLNDPRRYVTHDHRSSRLVVKDPQTLAHDVGPSTAFGKDIPHLHGNPAFEALTERQKMELGQPCELSRPVTVARSFRPILKPASTRLGNGGRDATA